MPENVLVFKREILDNLGCFQGVTRDVTKYKINKLYPVPRDQAEKDPALKQVIPYVVFTHGMMLRSETHREVFTYRRLGGGEKRLNGKRSIGIGGHVNDKDESYDAALVREINEELIITEPISHRVIAMLNDDSDPVGKVHFGIVHQIEIQDKSAIKPRESCIVDCCFRPIKDVKMDKFSYEKWSQHVLELF